jgi:dTMP kinase
MTTLLLMNASRYEHVQRKIIPALKTGRTVVTSRFADSSTVYQGHCESLQGQAMILQNLVAPGLKPDFTLYLDISVEEAQRRIEERKTAGDADIDWLELAQLEQGLKRIEGFKNLVDGDPDRFFVVDATQSIEAVKAAVVKWVRFTVVPQNRETKEKLKAGFSLGIGALIAGIIASEGGEK